MALRSKLIPQAVKLAMDRLGDRVICQACGATAETMADVCSAELSVECEGFKTYDAARTQALYDIGFFKSGIAR